MSTLSVTITPPNNFIMDGKHVTFRAPCDSNGVTGVFINDDPEVYQLMDSRGREMADFADMTLFSKGAMVYLVLDVEHHLAYVQNTNFESAAAVESFNGRHGVVVPEDGDYTYDMVGAAAVVHAHEHAIGGSDPLTPEMIGAATVIHAHQHAIGGSDLLTPEMIGAATKDHNHDGVYATKDHTHDDRYALLGHNHDNEYAPKRKVVRLTGNVNVTLEDNTEYICTDVTSLKFVDAKNFAFGTIRFISNTGSFTKPVASNFNTFAEQAGDEIVDAAAGQFWEFNTYEGNIIWKNWSDN